MLHLWRRKAISRRSVRCAGTCPRRSSETGGIPYRLRRTKAKAKAKAEEKVARVKEGELLEFSTADEDDGGVGVLAIGVLRLQLRAEQ